MLFSTPMVQALLAGKKTQTRRIVNSKWLPLVEEVLRCNGKWIFEAMDYDLTTPYGNIGDLLYVRETITHGGYEGAPLTYAADGKHSKYEWPVHWKKHCMPSIHMPRWASRLTLEITDIRIERLQDISDADAKAEGVELEISEGRFNCVGDKYVMPYGIKFMHLWKSINGKDSWAANPWVWVVEFHVHKKNIDNL